MLRVILLVSAMFAASALPAVAGPIFAVTLDTTSVAGMTGSIAFDLVDGDGAMNTTLELLGFVTDGFLGTATAIPPSAVTGLLPGTVTVSDTDFFNELNQQLTFGSAISFSFSPTTSVGAGLPDQFSFFILDSLGSPLFATTDPTGANALFAYDIDGSAQGTLQVFSPSITVTPVPAPSTIVLVGTGALLAAVRRRYRA